MSTQPIDYNVLARQAGAVSSSAPIDYDALAKQAGAVTAPPPAQRGVMDSVGDFASELWKQINPIAGIKGAAQIAAHPVDTFVNDANARKQVYDQAEDAFSKGDYAEGAAHLLYSAIPLLGPQLNDAANNFIAGNYAKGAGASTGMGLSMVAPAYAGDVADLAKSGIARGALLGKTPAEAYQSALKPSTALSEADRANIVDTGLKEGIPVSKTGVDKLSGLIDDLNQQIADKIKTGAAAGATVNPADVAARTSGVTSKFATQVNPVSDLNAIDAATNEFLASRAQPLPPGVSGPPALEPIPLDEAQALKQGTYRVLGGKAYGEQGSATIEAQKALARGLKEEIANQFPEIQGLNERESNLLDLQPALERAVNRIGNHQLLGIGTPITVGATKALTGSGALAGVAGVLKGVLDDPIVKSRLAISLAESGVPAAQIGQRLSSYQGLLGSAAVGHLTPSTSDTTADQNTQ